MIESLLHTAAHYQPFIPYAMLLIAIGGIMRAFVKNNPSARWRYWPWVSLFILATVIAWTPYVVPCLTTTQNTPPTGPQKLGVLTGPMSVGGNIERLIQAPNSAYRVKITAPNDKDSLAVRDAIAYFFRFPNSKCQIIDDDQDQHPDMYTLSEPTPESRAGIIYIHSPVNSAAVDTTREAIGSMGVKVRRNYTLPSNIPPDVIWVEIGTGSLWQ